MTEPGPNEDETDDAADIESADGPAWVRGARVRWFGVIVFLLMGVVALLVLLATILAIYDRARDDSPPPGSAVVASSSWSSPSFISPAPAWRR